MCSPLINRGKHRIAHETRGGRIMAWKGAAFASDQRTLSRRVEVPARLYLCYWGWVIDENAPHDREEPGAFAVEVPPVLDLHLCVYSNQTSIVLRSASSSTSTIFPISPS